MVGGMVRPGGQRRLIKPEEAGNWQDTHILTRALEESARAQKLAAQRVPVVQKEQQHQNGHNEHRGGNC